MVGPSYNQTDLLILLGQCTVELAFLRGRVAELEAQLKDSENAPNGTVEMVRVGAHPQ